MTTYRTIQIKFWDNEARKLSPLAKLLSVYLLTCKHGNMLGCFIIPIAYIVEDLELSTDEVLTALKELEEKNLCAYDVAHRRIFLNHFIALDPIKNPKQAQCVRKIFSEISDDCALLPLVADGLLKHGRFLQEDFVADLRRIIPKQEPTIPLNCGSSESPNSKEESIFFRPEINTETECAPHTAPASEGQTQSPVVPELEKNNSALPTDHAACLPPVELPPPQIPNNRDLKKQAVEILNFLNEKAGKSYRPVEPNLILIFARLKTGASVEDCQKVIMKKTNEWRSDPKMSEYLRPATLFNATKFEQYLGECASSKAPPASNTHSRQCAHVVNGQRCSSEGIFSPSIGTASAWYCRTHKEVRDDPKKATDFLERTKMHGENIKKLLEGRYAHEAM
jgi:uncharacterized phage protein (TIGR02220 family)